MDKISIGSRSCHAKLRRSGSNFTLSVDDETYEGVFSRKNGGIIHLNLGEKRTMGFSERNGNEIYVYANGINYVLRKESSSSSKQEAIEEENEDIVLSPITGKLLDKKVEDGTKVRKDDVIIVLEAMKMEHRLKAPRDGILSKLTVAEVGSQIKEGELMFELEDE